MLKTRVMLLDKKKSVDETGPDYYFQLIQFIFHKTLCFETPCA